MLERVGVKRQTANFLEKFFTESSIHGFPYVARKDFHWLERVIWLGVIVLSSCSAYFVFHDQWQRFQENPTMLSIQILSQGEFNRPAFTICTNYVNHSRAEEIVKKNWNTTDDSPRFQFLVDFVTNVSSLTYENMNDLQPFVNESDLNSADLLNIALSMKIDIPLPSKVLFTHVITEASWEAQCGNDIKKLPFQQGICQSSSKLVRFQNPFLREGQNITPSEHAKSCSSLEVCKTSVSPFNLGPTVRSTIFVNIFDEIMTGDSLDFVGLVGTAIIERTQKIEQIVSEPKLIKFKPKSRKCLFASESKSKYFDVYTVNLCKTDCRITRALAVCGCVPFFYSIAMSKEKVCDIKGMLCLDEKKSNWYNTTDCDCPSLCETTIMTKMSTKQEDLSFDRVLTVELIFPKIRIQRTVVFDFDDLIVGLGGSVAFFLGFSFLTGIEMLYFVIEYAIDLAVATLVSCVIKED